MRSLLALGALLLVFAFAGDAKAYPHFQFSSDTTACNLCHYAPAGGGLLTGWGREEAGDTLSWGGEGAFLHELIELPDALSMGGDFRGAAMLKDSGTAEGAELLFFPMQADLSARYKAGPIAIAGTVGLRGQARKAELADGSDREEGDIASRIVSREHYVEYRPGSSKLSVRAGRFYAPYGLRVADHTSYIRRYLGFNILEETYNLSASYLKNESETHMGGHVSDVLVGRDEADVGLTAMHERRGEKHALGTSLRVTRQSSQLRALAGTHYKRWFEGPKILLMAELDAGYQRFAESSDNSRMQLAAYAGPVWFPIDGVSTSLAYELFDEDLLVKHVERQALTSWVSILPRAHFEILFLGRAERIGPKEEALTAMMQLHYYL